MEIAFLTLNAKSALYYSLARTFAQNGHHVTVITPNQKFSNHIEKNGLIDFVCFKALPIAGVRGIKKGIADFLFSFFCKKGLRRLYKTKADLIIATTPPLGFYGSIKLLKKRNLKAKSYLILRDIWPEAFKLFDFDKKHPIIYEYYLIQERRLYAVSDIIGCMSQGNLDFIKENNPQFPQKRLKLLPNWGDCEPYFAPNSSIRDKYNLEGKFVLVYGGNMGVPQGLSNILELASMKKDCKDVVFLLVGDGTERGKIEKQIIKEGLTNVKIMNSLPRDDYDELLRTCDVGLISLNKKLKTPSIPSKTISYWNLQIPILAIIDNVTDYGKILDTSLSGLWSTPDDVSKTSSNFDLLYQNPQLRKELGENGYHYLESFCSAQNAYLQILEQLGI